VLLVRYTGVRISDAATLARARVREGQILLHTKKTVGAVFLPIPKILEDALAALPAPRRAAPRRIRAATSGMKSPPAALRWARRNDFIRRLQAQRCSRRSLAQVPAYAGDGDLSARRHRAGCGGYSRHQRGGGAEAHAKWSRARQDRITQIFRAVHPEAFGGETVVELVQNVYTKRISP